MRIQSLSGLLAAAVIAGACSEISYPVLPAEEFTATLLGTNEVPVVTTPATGTARFGVINDSILTWRIELAVIDSVTASHIHLGAAGVPGGIIVTLFTGPGGASPCRDANGLRINTASARCRDNYTGPLPPNQLKASQMTQLPAGFGATARARFDSLLVLMRNGGVYVNVHTRANGGGELRGQTAPM